MLDESTVLVIEIFATLEMKRTIAHSDTESLKLSIGPFLPDILHVIDNIRDGLTRSVVQATPHKDIKRLYLFSGHDTTIIPLLLVLGVFDGQWPAYSASVTLELLQDARSRDKLYVRALHDDTPLVLPACGGSTLCPLDVFEQHLKKFIVDDYAAACQPKNPKTKSGKKDDGVVNAAITGSEEKKKA